MKKMFIGLFIFCFIFILSFNIFAAEDINVKINDEIVTFDSEPIMENDRILVPIRAIAEKMLFDVQWEESTQKVTLENASTTVFLYIGNDQITKELKYASDTCPDKRKVITSDVVAKEYNDRTYLPLRVISELFGAKVDWNDATNTAEITYDFTRGEPITFKDKGIEYLTRLAITLGDFDTTDLNNIDYETYLYIDTLEVYDGIIYEGSLYNISTLGVNTELRLIDLLYTINDISDINKFKNLQDLYLPAQCISDISPILYKDTWRDLDFSNNPILDFSVLNDIKVSRYIIVGYFYYQFSYLNQNYSTDLKTSSTDLENYRKFSTTLNKIFSIIHNVINENITDKMNRSEKLEVINNWIISNIKYDYEYLKYGDYRMTTLYTAQNPKLAPSSLERAILDGYGICSGYTDVFSIFCDILKIPCIAIGDYAFNGESIESHAWNLVELEDGKLYHIDSTWNCASNDYFLVSDEEIKTDHFWDPDSIQGSFNYKKECIPYWDSWFYFKSF